MMGWGYGMGSGWLLMTISLVLLIAVLIGLAVWIFPRETRHGGGPQQQPPGPHEVLDQRLARGEIDVETYRTLREELTRTDPTRR